MSALPLAADEIAAGALEEFGVWCDGRWTLTKCVGQISFGSKQWGLMCGLKQWSLISGAMDTYSVLGRYLLL